MEWLQADLAHVVKEGLAERGWSQRELAARVGITEFHVSRLLNGHSPGGLDTWTAMLDQVRTEGTPSASIDVRPPS